MHEISYTNYLAPRCKPAVHQTRSLQVSHVSRDLTVVVFLANALLSRRQSIGKGSATHTNTHADKHTHRVNLEENRLRSLLLAKNKHCFSFAQQKAAETKCGKGRFDRQQHAFHCTHNTNTNTLTHREVNECGARRVGADDSILFFPAHQHMSDTAHLRLIPVCTKVASSAQRDARGLLHAPPTLYYVNTISNAKQPTILHKDTSIACSN